MVRYKHVDLSPRFLAVDLEKQLLPGSFAYAVHHLLENDFDLSGFDGRYRNDATGAPKQVIPTCEVSWSWARELFWPAWATSRMASVVGRAAWSSGAATGVRWWRLPPRTRGWRGRY